MNPVFVYGILKGRYGARAGYVRDFRLVDMGWFPAAIPNDASQIRGELIKVDDAALYEFDRIEGAPNFYARQLVEVVLDDGETVAAEMYVINKNYWKRTSKETASLDITQIEDRIEYEYCPQRP